MDQEQQKILDSLDDPFPSQLSPPSIQNFAPALNLISNFQAKRDQKNFKKEEILSPPPAYNKYEQGDGDPITNQDDGNKSLISEQNETLNSTQSNTTLNSTNTKPPKQHHQSQRYIHCKVCHAFINVTLKLHQSVVRCNSCKEATPIRGAPAGKQYVRCPCNSLLICKANSSRILCPRQNCGRTITIIKNVPKQHTSLNEHFMREDKNLRLIGQGLNNKGNQLLNNLNAERNKSKNQLSTQTIHSPYSAIRNKAFGSNNSINSTNIRHKNDGNYNYRANNEMSDSIYKIYQNGNNNSNMQDDDEQPLLGNSSTSGRNIEQVTTNPSKSPRLVRLQCAFCHMEFVRLRPLASFGTCPHCETSMPFGQKYTRIRQSILGALSISCIIAGALIKILLGENTENGSNFKIFSWLSIILYILGGVFLIGVARYSCMRVTNVADS